MSRITPLKDSLLDIATEEMGHLEMVGMLIEQHTSGEAKMKAEDVSYSHCGAGARTSLTASALPGRRATSTKAAMLLAIFGPILLLKRAHDKLMSH